MDVNNFTSNPTKYRIRNPGHPTTINPCLLSSNHDINSPSNQTIGGPACFGLGESAMSFDLSFSGQTSHENTVTPGNMRPTNGTSQVGIGDGKVPVGSGGGALDISPNPVRISPSMWDMQQCFDVNAAFGYASNAGSQSVLLQEGFDHGNGQQQHHDHHHHHSPYLNLTSLQNTGQTTPHDLEGFAAYGQHHQHQQQQYPGPSLTPQVSSMSPAITASLADQGSHSGEGSSQDGTEGVAITSKKERNKWTPKMDQFLWESKMKGMTTLQISEEMQMRFPGVNTGKDSLSKRFKRIQEKNPDPFTQAAERAVPRIMAVFLEELGKTNTNDTNMMFAPGLAGILADNKELGMQVMKGFPRAFTQTVQNQVNSTRRSLSLNFSISSPPSSSSVPYALAHDNELEEQEDEEDEE
ncbi:hypothetical protein V8F33_006837 [Rhypophila sp. PSN 637]